MASSVGTLRARLGLDAKPFERGLKGARGRAMAFAKGVARSMALAGAAMVAAAAAGAGALTKSSLKFIDDQAKIARSIDSTIDGLRALQIAAGDAGIGPDTLNQSMQKLGVRLVEAKVKGGAAADALKRMGLDADAMLAMDGDARLATIADRIKELGLSSAQASQFLLDMGIESKEMALLLTGGGDAIRAARQEVEDLGLSLSKVDAAKVESANDAMSRIKLTTEALGNRLAVAFAPALERIAVSFTGAMQEGSGFRSMVDSIGTRVSALTGFFADLSTIVSSAFEALRGGGDVEGRFGAINAAVSAILTPIAKVATGARSVMGFLAGVIEVTGSWGAAMTAIGPIANAAFARVGEALSVLALRAGSAMQAISGEAAKAFQGVVTFAFDMANKVIGVFVGAAKSAVAAWDALPQAFQRIGALAINALIDAMQSGLSGIVSTINSFTGFLKIPPIPAPDLGKWKATPGAAAQIGAKVGAAFSDGFNGNYVGKGSTLIGEIGDDLLAAAKSSAALADARAEGLTRPLEGVAALQDKIKVAGDAAAESLRRTDEEAKNLDGTLGGMGADTGDADAGGGAAKSAGGGGGASGGAAAQIEKVTSAVERIETALAPVREGFQTLFTDVIKGAKSGRAALGDFLSKLADIGLNKVFNSLWSGGIGALSGGGGGGGIGGFLKNLIPGFSRGTGFAPGGLARVNEMGGELINLPRGSQVIPHTLSKQMVGAGGGTVELVLHAPEGVTIEQVRNETDMRIRYAAPGIAQTAMQGVFKRQSATKRSPV